MRQISNALRSKLRTASTIFAQRGFDGTTIEALSETTGIPSSTLYYNFTGKNEILAFLLQDWLERTSAGVEAAIASNGSASDRLAAVVTAQLDAMANDPATCQVLLAELGRIDRLPHIADAVQSAFHRPVAKLLADGAAHNCFRKVDIEHATSVLYGAVIITGLHHVIASDGVVPAFDSAEVAATVMDLVLHGLISS
jgi:TetR/AcrR family transcriptional regulator